MEGVTVTLPWPPSSNKHLTVARGRKILAPKTRRWYKDATCALAEQDFEPMMGTIFLEIYLYPPSKVRFDPDNRVKCVLDALVKNNVIEDDHNGVIQSLSIHCMPVDKENPRAVVDIYEDPPLDSSPDTC